MEKEKRIIQVKCIAYAIVTFVILSFLAFAQIGIINANAEEIEVDQSEQPVPNPYEYTYFDQAYYGKDGLHYSRAYYRLWLQDVTNQMDLWGDNFK